MYKNSSMTVVAWSLLPKKKPRKLQKIMCCGMRAFVGFQIMLWPLMQALTRSPYLGFFQVHKLAMLRIAW
ncbi:hypothetical protein AAW02_01275 [Aeromonas dhakensis]|nr:hypothetical protein AAW03_05220 [Aeromonas dhakensis]PHS90535.1 hypothetical protein AAW02_01275 [Aeromonas dhakensis]